jgi:diketogulonate reductase-like aldo/keto reductase
VIVVAGHGQPLVSERQLPGDGVIDVLDTVPLLIDQVPCQVVLRWHIERGDIVFPKSVTPSRIKENFDIFDFELSDGDVAEISALNKNERTGPDPDKFDTV